MSALDLRHALAAGEARSRDELAEDLTLALRVNAQQLDIIFRMTQAATAASLNLQTGTLAGADEALELNSSAAVLGRTYLAQADARPDLSGNIVFLAAHRVEIVGGAR